MCPSFPVADIPVILGIVQVCCSADSCPLTDISVILPKSLSVFPFTVILTYCAEWSGILYLSEDVICPVLFTLAISLKITPSFEVDITKLYALSSPLYHAISISHKTFD
jgi:hypothetical protein